MHAVLLSLLLVALPVSVRAADPGAPKRLVIIGDSLTEGYGVSKDKAYPTLLQEKIKKLGKNYMVINAGISGSTSASAVSRMSWQLKNKPEFILLALGANDGLRGLPVKAMEDNLNKAVALAKTAGVKIMLAGMRLPPNYGQAYVDDFTAAFTRVAQKNGVPLLPFILEGVGGVADLNLTDRIHPNEKGHTIVADTVFNFIQKYL